MNKILRLFGLSLIVCNLVFADDCELISPINGTSGKFCCKVDGKIERTCTAFTSETCQLQGEAGTVNHCKLLPASGQLPAHISNHIEISSHTSKLNYGVEESKIVQKTDEPREYSVNLMWVNETFKPSQKYIFPIDEGDPLKEKFFAHLSEWAKTNPEAPLNLWYDSEMVSDEALKNTQDLLKEQFPLFFNQIYFKYLRDLPEVRLNPQVFSTKIPLYFRVDLFRVIAAYHTLKEANQLGKKFYFVYSDIDVTPMSEEVLLDSETKKKLDQFGIIMAHGGLNKHKFENSFQIFASDKPNLLKAIKYALIDINIDRANNILDGGSWAFRRAGDTSPLVQQVYDSYEAMFYYYYQLQGWGVTSLSGEPIDFKKPMEQVLGLSKLNAVTFKSTDPSVQLKKDEFNQSSGKIEHVDTLIISRKIITAPPSRFGGQPTQFDPNKITFKNYTQKLEEELQKNGSFNNSFLTLAVRNHDSVSTSRIVKHLSPQELAQAAFTLSKDYAFYPEIYPFMIACEEENHEAIQFILEKFKGHPNLLEKAVEEISKPLKKGYSEESSVGLIAKKGDSTSAELLFKAFLHSSNLMMNLAEGFSGKKFSKGLPPLIEAAARNHQRLIQSVFERYSSDSKARTELEGAFVKSDYSGNSMIYSLIRNRDVSQDTFRTLRQTFLKDSKLIAQALLMENRNAGNTLYAAIEKGRFKEIEILIGDLSTDKDFMSKWAETLTYQDRFYSNIFHTASKQGNVDGIRFLQQLFSAYPELLSEALKATDFQNKTPLDLAQNEETKKAIQAIVEK